ncbi:MAG: hypothetical protein KAT43_01505 [Nanoarchaeota archaeon]|nr:hypothetical protein [Nanoarchaeota archaeon]
MVEEKAILNILEKIQDRKANEYRDESKEGYFKELMLTEEERLFLDHIDKKFISVEKINDIKDRLNLDDLIKYVDSAFFRPVQQLSPIEFLITLAKNPPNFSEKMYEIPYRYEHQCRHTNLAKKVDPILHPIRSRWHKIWTSQEVFEQEKLEYEELNLLIQNLRILRDMGGVCYYVAPDTIIKSEKNIPLSILRQCEGQDIADKIDAYESFLLYREKTKAIMTRPKIEHIFPDIYNYSRRVGFNKALNNYCRIENELNSGVNNLEFSDEPIVLFRMLFLSNIRGAEESDEIFIDKVIAKYRKIKESNKDYAMYILGELFLRNIDFHDKEPEKDFIAEVMDKYSAIKNLYPYHGENEYYPPHDNARYIFGELFLRNMCESKEKIIKGINIYESLLNKIREVLDEIQYLRFEPLPQFKLGEAIEAVEKYGDFKVEPQPAETHTIWETEYLEWENPLGGAAATASRNVPIVVVHKPEKLIILPP